MKYSIYVDDVQQSVWEYFYDLSVEEDTDDDIRAIQIQTEMYLDEVESALISICEMFALIAYKHLIKISDKFRDEYT